MLKDWDVVNTAFSDLFLEEFKNEYLFQFFYFSSNLCHFLENTILGSPSKTADCPIGNFICTKDGQIIDTNETVDFSTAKSFCSDQSYELSEFVLLKKHLETLENEIQNRLHH